MKRKTNGDNDVMQEEGKPVKDEEEKKAGNR